MNFVNQRKKKPRTEFNSISVSSLNVAHGRNPTKAKVHLENNILERIANELTEDDDLQDKDNDQFCVTHELTPADINIEVDSLGAMTFPINQQYIQKLTSISSKAQFGLRHQTILDENIRNTYEIKSDKLRITINEQSLTCMLSKMCDALGLSKNSVLTSHLHNMLIYGPGQFFDMHQDTEKLQGMVASLVIVLPSPHIGGDLIIEHGTKRHVFSSENVYQRNAKCIGFYSDCRHKVEKIKQGYRIVLTYNLVLNSEEISNKKDVNQQLKDAIKDYFDIEVDKQLNDKEPQKLVYFLNHSYTEHGLRLSMLKGADRANASALLGVAWELGLVLHLALVEIQESWSTEGGYYDSDPDIGERLEDEDKITLSYWLDSNNQHLPFDKCTIDKDEICWTIETDSFEPYDKKYEGYMGNYGGNMEYWYRRAAIVLWPKSSQIPMNFMLNYTNALNELDALSNSVGNESEAMEIILKAGKYLRRRSYEKEKSDLEKFTNIALYIKDKGMALSILSPFKWEILNSDTAKLLVKLQTQYGISWFSDLLNSWKTDERQSTDFLINEIHSFVQTFLNYGGAAEIVELLLDAQSNALVTSMKEAYAYTWTWKALDPLPKRMDKIFEILAACAAIQNIPVLDKVVAHLISNPKLYPHTSLAEMFFKLQDTVSSEFFSNYEQLRSHLVKTIDSILSSGMRSNDDWSIQANVSCQCEHCKVVMTFLHSKTYKTKIWPIRKEIRRHIYITFNNLGLPVDFRTERTGSPFKMIMTKKEGLHKDARKGFDELKFYRQKLEK